MCDTHPFWLKHPPRGPRGGAGAGADDSEAIRCRGRAAAGVPPVRRPRRGRLLLRRPGEAAPGMSGDRRAARARAAAADVRALRDADLPRPVQAGPGRLRPARARRVLCGVLPAALHRRVDRRAIYLSSYLCIYCVIS